MMCTEGTFRRLGCTNSIKIFEIMLEILVCKTSERSRFCSTKLLLISRACPQRQTPHVARLWKQPTTSHGPSNLAVMRAESQKRRIDTDGLAAKLSLFANLLIWKLYCSFVSIVMPENVLESTKSSSPTRASDLSPISDSRSTSIPLAAHLPFHILDVNPAPAPELIFASTTNLHSRFES
ncbi:hypothetical protein EVAR_76453_1 [Eumeta japonica]|uniref:Uncharacterized protein n=1 Tax=Eumeta variegata TaxID=151549 RepID=A0A4C1T823_EUMVA|nr:hypothetical protein EVAR_76453_1 [Eumeta japonica]